MQKQQDWLGKAPRARDTNSMVLFSSVDETTPYFMKSSQRIKLAPESLVVFKNSGVHWVSLVDPPMDVDPHVSPCNPDGMVLPSEKQYGNPMYPHSISRTI